MNYQTIQRSSTSELVIEQILQSVHSGELQPGDKLPPERELTKMFGVGRSTLREAISALVLVGYLEVVQGRGTFLKSELPSVTLSASDLNEVHTAANIMDLVEVREILECNAVKLAAHRADPNDIRQLSEVLAQMEATVDDIKQFSEYDFEFHITLARATRNAVILEMMKLIVTKVHEQYERFSRKTLFRTDRAVETAAQILSSVADGDGEQASRLMQEHLNLVTTELKRMVPGP
jgi:GntR family transcriptional repressor for pyruvate dehydrogenase complex